MTKKRRLIKLLQQAHASERGAIVAYEFHAKAVREDCMETVRILTILKEELEHLIEVREILASFGAKPSIFRDFLMIFIGFFAGILCFCSSSRMIDFGAAFMEKLGANKYKELADLAEQMDETELAEKFDVMWAAEESHVVHFITVPEPAPDN